MNTRSLALLALFVLPLSNCVCETVEAGDAGVYIIRGVVQPQSPLPPGYFSDLAWNADVFMVSTRQQTKDVKADCFSSDLQQIDVVTSVMFHIPEKNVVDVYTQYHGDPFDTLVARRVQEAVKEATATRSAADIVKEREKVKAEALIMLRKNLGEKTVIIDDIVLTDIALTKSLKDAIEAKMVQEQEAARAGYKTAQAVNDAATAKAVAQGEADAISVKAAAEANAIKLKGDALRQNPGVVQLNLIEKWNGSVPQIVSGGQTGLNIVMPAANLEK